MLVEKEGNIDYTTSERSHIDAIGANIATNMRPLRGRNILSINSSTDI